MTDEPLYGVEPGPNAHWLVVNLATRRVLIRVLSYQAAVDEVQRRELIARRAQERDEVAK